MQFNHWSENKWKWAHLFQTTVKKATALVEFDCLLFQMMLRKVATPVWVLLFSVKCQWFGDRLGSCRDENRVNP